MIFYLEIGREAVAQLGEAHRSEASRQAYWELQLWTPSRPVSQDHASAQGRVCAEVSSTPPEAPLNRVFVRGLQSKCCHPSESPTG